MNLIVAADETWGIGREGRLLAHLPGDMKYFRETTMGKTVVMGRKTLESFPEGKPLRNRVNIVLSRDMDYSPEGVKVFHSVEETLEALSGEKGEDIFIIGGGAVYREFLPYCTRAYVTHIYHTFEADTDFPDLDGMKEWELESVSPRMEQDGLSYEFRIYRRAE